MTPIQSPLPLAASRSSQSRRAADARGFSLVEVMVALVIGMLGILVMMQLFGLFEGQKRTTTGGDDAITGGAVSLYSLQRAVQQSGLGMNSLSIIGCSVGGLLNTGERMPLAPVTIYAAGVAPAGYPAIPFTPDANTDVVLIVSGNTTGSVEGDNIDSLPAPTTYQVHTPTAFRINDRVVAVPLTRPANCNILVATRVTGIGGSNVTVAAAPGYAAAVSDKLFNLGQAPSVLAYAVRNQNLTVCDYADLATNCSNENAWVGVAGNVVSLRAEYGRDTTAPMDGAVDVWDQTTPVTACAFARASALRVVLVARSAQPEKTSDWPAQTEHVTDVAPNWVGGVSIDLSDAALSPGGASWPTWQDFRYKTFQSTVPLRNLTILGALTEC